jgi:hypothetical protein
MKTTEQEFDESFKSLEDVFTKYKEAQAKFRDLVWINPAPNASQPRGMTPSIIYFDDFGYRYTASTPEGFVLVPKAVADAAIVWAYCPPQGGYHWKDDEEYTEDYGGSIEDTCEELLQAVVEWTGVEPSEDYLTKSEMLARLTIGKGK